MIRLVADGEPGIVALQEVPVWALPRLAGWSGMASFGAVARPARLGALGRRLTTLAPDVFRSAFNGQANALLVGRSLEAVGEQRVETIRERGVVERRVCQLVRIARSTTVVLVANFHATAHRPDKARTEIARVGELVSGEGPAIVCGDFNAPQAGIRGFSPPIPGLDQILVRGLDLERRPAAWERDRRRVDGVLLSDHAPVEAVVARTWPRSGPSSRSSSDSRT
jgi:endonuclease/exonuclease/phosphatase family metal-dependent hydrolase